MMLPSTSKSAIKSVLKIFIHLIIRLWKLASSFCILAFFVAWFYGGSLPYIICIVAVFSLGYHLSDSLLYQPEVPLESRIYVPLPNTVSLPYEVVNIYTKDRIKLHSYLILQDSSILKKSPTILYFHGNAGNIGHRLENVKIMYKRLKCNVLLLEYRGYGLSEGKPDEEGLYLDAQAALDFIESRSDLDSSKIILFGRSLGGAIAIDLASRCNYRDRIAALIIENSFLSIPLLAPVIIPVSWIKLVPKIYYKNKFDSFSKCPCIVCPTLFISGEKDELIPPNQMKLLYSRCGAQFKEIKLFPGSHNDTWTCSNYFSSFDSFITKALEHGSTQITDRVHLLTTNFADDIV